MTLVVRMKLTRLLLRMKKQINILLKQIRIRLLHIIHHKRRRITDLRCVLLVDWKRRWFVDLRLKMLEISRWMHRSHHHFLLIRS